MGAAERHENNQDARTKNRARTEQRQKNRATYAELRRVAMSNAPPHTCEEAASAVEKAASAVEKAASAVEKAASAVEKAAAAKRAKAKELRSARCAVSQQRKTSRRMKREPSGEN